MREFVSGRYKSRRNPCSDGRRFLNPLLVGRSGQRWRDLPEERFGPHQTAKQCYYEWIEQGVCDAMFEAVSTDPDFEWLSTDANVIRAQAQAAGAQAEGPSFDVITIEEEAIIVAFRRHTLLPLDNCLYALQATIPRLTRSSLYRCLQPPNVTGDKTPKRKLEAYPIGYFHIHIAGVSAAESKAFPSVSKGYARS